MKYLLQGCTKKEAELRAKPRKSNDQRDRGRQAKKERGQIKVKKERIFFFLIMQIFFTKETSSEKMDQNQKGKKEHQSKKKKQERRKRNNMVGHHKGIKGVGANTVLKTNVALTQSKSSVIAGVERVLTETNMGQIY